MLGDGILKMPSLSTLFKKRRSLQSPPTKDQSDSGENRREAVRLNHGSENAAAATPLQVAELEALARLAESSDDQAIASPTIATGPRRHSAAPRPGAGTGRLNRYVSTHDPFRRFRSRSTQFRVSGGIESDARTRLSWPVRRSTSQSPETPDTGRGHAQAQAQAEAEAEAEAPEDAPAQVPQCITDARPLNVGVSAREASLAALERPLAAESRDEEVVQQEEEGEEEEESHQQNKKKKKKKKTSNTDNQVRAEKAKHSHSNSSTSFGMQQLKRLPSLSLKRGFSRRMSTAVSQGYFFFGSCFVVPMYLVWGLPAPVHTPASNPTFYPRFDQPTCKSTT